MSLQSTSAVPANVNQKQLSLGFNTVVEKQTEVKNQDSQSALNAKIKGILTEKKMLGSVEELRAKYVLEALRDGLSDTNVKNASLFQLLLHLELNNISKIIDHGCISAQVNAVKGIQEFGSLSSAAAERFYPNNNVVPLNPRA